MFCPKCGTQLPDTATFCGGCGTQLQAVQVAPYAGAGAGTGFTGAGAGTGFTGTGAGAGAGGAGMPRVPYHRAGVAGGGAVNKSARIVGILGIIFSPLALLFLNLPWWGVLVPLIGLTDIGTWTGYALGMPCYVICTILWLLVLICSAIALFANVQSMAESMRGIARPVSGMLRGLCILAVVLSLLTVVLAAIFASDGFMWIFPAPFACVVIVMGILAFAHSGYKWRA